MSAQIGSVFLGDVQRHRILSPTPPSSPDPVPTKKFVPAKQSSTSQKPPTITPELSLELRLRWLEALLYGVRPKDKSLEKGETLLRNAQQIKKRLDDLVQNNDSLRKFMDQCTCPAHIALWKIYLTALYSDRRPVCPSPCALRHHPERSAFLREHDPIRAGNLPARDGTGYSSCRPRYARNRGT